ncbi:MAG: EFR1 family ferrodoxin [Clostridia bacterium]|nr:EFR1 family ferrodoxin [Clostridia bacterium]
MLKTVDFYYFSPTGGTKKAGGILASGITESVNENNLANKEINAPSSDVVIIAAPVFAGRIPALVVDKISKLNGAGKKAITAVVYGVRAYDDALLELNDAMKNSGFDVIASAALVAQHSMVPEIGAGRPDESDIAEICQFAKNVLKTIESGKTGNPVVPGNRPYKDGMKVSATPLSLPGCTACGYCASICPVEAISITAKKITTDINKCMLCMACVANCPERSRILPPPMQAGLAERLGVFKDVRRENEFFE